MALERRKVDGAWQTIQVADASQDGPLTQDLDAAGANITNIGEAGISTENLIKQGGPLTHDLDANNVSITNVLGVFTGDFAGSQLTDERVIAPEVNLVGEVNVQVLCGSPDPSADVGVVADPASLYLHQVSETEGKLWLKTGAEDTAWTEIGV